MEVMAGLGFSPNEGSGSISGLFGALPSLRHDGEESEEGFVSVLREISFFGAKGFNFIGEAEGDHGFCFVFLNVRFGEKTVEGFPDVGRGGRGELFLDGGDELLDGFVHDGGGLNEKGDPVKDRLCRKDVLNLLRN